MGLGMQQSTASSTAVDTVNSRTGVPQIGITGPASHYLGRTNSEIGEEEEDWDGENERLERRQVENFPPPPRQYMPSYKPSNPQMGTWRGT